MLSQMWFFFFSFCDLVFRSSRNVPSWIWLHGPASSLSRASPELGSAPPEWDRGGTSTSRSVPPSLSLRPSFPLSLSVRLRQCTRHIPSVSSPAESLWITPPKKKGRVPMSHRLHIKPLRINNPPHPQPRPFRFYFLTRHRLQLETVSHAPGFVLCQNVTASLSNVPPPAPPTLPVQPHSPAVGFFFFCLEDSRSCQLSCFKWLTLTPSHHFCQQRREPERLFLNMFSEQLLSDFSRPSLFLHRQRQGSRGSWHCVLQSQQSTQHLHAHGKDLYGLLSQGGKKSPQKNNVGMGM